MTEVHESTGSYALHALDAVEHEEFEAHLATCLTCQNEVADFDEIAVDLSVLNLVTPPPSLRQNILDAVRTILQVSAPDGPATMTTLAATNGSRPIEQTLRSFQMGGPRRALPETDVPSDPPQFDEVAVHRQRRRNRTLSALVAAILAVAVGLGGTVYTLIRDRQAQAALAAAEEQLYQAPDARTFTETLSNGGQVTFIASKQLNQALFIGTALPDPGPDNRYQLWTGTGNPTAEKGTLQVARDNQVVGVDPGGKVFFSGSVATADFLAVNLEPRGSTTQTPSTPLLAAVII